MRINIGSYNSVTQWLLEDKERQVLIDRVLAELRKQVVALQSMGSRSPPIEEHFADCSELLVAFDGLGDAYDQVSTETFESIELRLQRARPHVERAMLMDADTDASSQGGDS